MQKLVTMLFASIIASFTCQSQMRQAGTLSFGTEPFTEGKLPQIKNSFRSDEFIYMQAIGFNKEPLYTFSFKENPGIKKEWSYFYTIAIHKDGKLKHKTGEEEISYKDFDLSVNAFNIDLMPEPAKATTIFYGYSWKDCKGLYEEIHPSTFNENGTYKITVEVYDKVNDDWGKQASKKDWPVFTGSFDFVFNSKDVQKLKANQLEARKAVQEYATRRAGDRIRQAHAEQQKKETEERKVPDGWKAKSHALTGGVSMEQIKKAILSGTSGKQILKVYVGEDRGWKVEKNNLGIPTRKIHMQIIEAYVKLNDGRCGYNDVTIYQDYTGGGRYSGKKINTYFTELVCDKLN